MDSDYEFEAIFLEHYPRVLGILLRLTGNRAQAEDLANDVFWRLSRRPVHWLVTNNVGGWLYRTATYAGIDALRAANRRRHHEHAAALDDHAGPALPLAGVLREEARRSVQHVLASMKPAQAQLLLMRADGCSYRELAQALKVAPGSVGTLLNRAEAEFRKRYLRATGKKEIL
jgi:RNA polymerase sigma-70 factor, ECF subfamily